MKFRSNWLVTGVFLSVLKTAKVVPVFKKDSKLDYSNYCPISLLSNIEKNTWKNLCIKDCIPFSITTLFRTYSLDLDNNISCLNQYYWEYKKSSWWWKYRLWSFCRLAKSFWYCRPSDTVSKIESLWDSWSFKWLV